ncbi:MAG: GreA/GreB family elongation factor [bacterium]
MDNNNVYKMIFSYLNKQFSNLELEVEELGNKIDGDIREQADLQSFYGEDHNWSGADNDMISKRNIFDKKVRNFNKMQHLISELEKIYKKKKNFTHVEFGCVFSLQNQRKKTEYFLLAEGDDNIKVNNKEIWICSRNSPMGKAVLGKKRGEALKVNKAEYKIKEII